MQTVSCEAAVGLSCLESGLRLEAAAGCEGPCREGPSRLRQYLYCLLRGAAGVCLCRGGCWHAWNMACAAAAQEQVWGQQPRVELHTVQAAQFGRLQLACGMGCGTLLLLLLLMEDGPS